LKPNPEGERLVICEVQFIVLIACNYFALTFWGFLLLRYLSLALLKNHLFKNSLQLASMVGCLVEHLSGFVLPP
jgi:hypothetical protein